MSDAYDPVTPTYRDPEPPTWTGTSTATDEPTGTADVAKEQASQVKDTAVDAGKNVAGTAKEEVKNVAAEAKTQAKDLLGQTRSQLGEQAGEQQKRVATGLHSISDELHDMADKSENSGTATNLVKQAASRAGDAASWLDDRDPGSLLDEVSRFARQRPGTFVAIAAVAGVLAGRFTRSVVSEAKDSHDASTGTSTTPSAAHLTDPPLTTPANFSETAAPTVGSGAYAATTDNFDTAGDYVGSGDPTSDDAPYSTEQIDEPPLSVGNEPYRTPVTDAYREDDQR